MNIPSDTRFLSHPFFLRSLRKEGFAVQVYKANRAAAYFQLQLNTVLLGDRSKDQETRLIEAIAEMEIYLSAVINALDAQSDARTAIQARLEALNAEKVKT
jgi:hypothetical protein